MSLGSALAPAWDNSDKSFASPGVLPPLLKDLIVSGPNKLPCKKSFILQWDLITYRFLVRPIFNWEEADELSLGSAPAPAQDNSDKSFARPGMLPPQLKDLKGSSQKMLPCKQNLTS